MTPVLSFAIFATLTAYAVAMALAVYRLLRAPGRWLRLAWCSRSTSST